MDDLISRQAAIDALAEMHCKSDEDGYVWIIRSDAWARLDALPPAQSEIVRCGDCIHFVRDDYEEFTPYGFYNTDFYAFCDKHWDEEEGKYREVKIDDFCSWAERK